MQSGVPSLPVEAAELATWPCGCLSLDARGIVLTVNRALCRLVQLSAEQIVGQPFDRLLSNASRVLYQSYLQPLLRLHGHVEEFALTLRQSEGGSPDVLVYTGRREADDSAVIDMVLAPIRQRRRIEDEMLRIKRAADQAPGLVFQLLQLADGGLHFPYASEAIRRLYAVTPDQARASADQVFRQLHADDRQALQVAMRQAAREGSDLHCIYRLRAPDGSPRWHELQATQRHLAHGSILWHGHIADITERKQMQAAVAEQQTLERVHRARNEFLSRVSHELRTPLNGILGFAQLLESDKADNLSIEQQERLRLLRSSGQHLLQLINQVLEVTRLEAGQMEVQMQTLELAPQLELALSQMQPQAGSAGVALLPLEVAAGLTVQADALRLQQVLLNLLSNAIKYNHPGGHVRLSVQQLDGGLCIAVSDTGPGLSARQQAELFQPFQRLGAEKTTVEGYGLGLVISRHLVTLMGGRLTLHSEPGAGCRFEVHLAMPVGLGAACDRPGDDPAAALDAGAGGACGTVLYVEDNPVNAMLMEAIVGMRPGLRLSLATDGASALAAARAAPPELLLLDMHLPDISGMALLPALRRIEAMADVPAIMVSAAAAEEDVAAARAQGFVGYWTKPLDVDQTLREFDRLLPPHPRSHPPSPQVATRADPTP